MKWAMAGAALMLGGICSSSASAGTYTFAGYTWEQNETPDQLGLLGNGAVLGGATFSSNLPNRITQSVGFIALSGSSGSGFVGAPGFDPGLSLGVQANTQLGLTQSDGTGSEFSSAINLPRGDAGSSVRHGLEVSWSGGRILDNGAGADFVLYESGSNATSPEGQMVRVRRTDGTYSNWFYQAANSFETYTKTGGTLEGAFATAYDLSSLGLLSHEAIDLIQIANLTSGDRIAGSAAGTFAQSGFVVFGDTSNTLGKASVGSLTGLNANSTFSSGGLDPDPLYVGVLNGLSTAAPVPLPAAAWSGLALMGGLATWRRLRRKPRD